MQRRTFMQSVAAGTVGLIGLRPRIDAHAATSGALEEAFRDPPAAAHCKTWWHWMNGNVTAEGVTLDLEAMKRVGIRGFQIFQVGTGIPKGPVDYSSAEHSRLLQHAAREADRLGMEFDIMNCPGWSSSGGPWITPELSMKQFTWSETLVPSGGRQVVTMLPQPYTKLGYYRDALVLAFPALEGERQAWQQTLRAVRTNTGPVDASVLSGIDQPGGIAIRPPAGDQEGFLQLEFSEPFAARSLVYYANPLVGEPRHSRQQTANRLEVSDDGTQFRKICDIDGWASGPEEVEVPGIASFPETHARFYRIVSSHPVNIHHVEFSGAARLPHWTRKANFTRSPGYGSESTDVPRGSTIDASKVIDLTEHLEPNGRLTWDAPQGAWTVLRIGQTTTGVMNHPAPDGGLGLECDKFSREAYDFHFDHFFKDLLAALGPLASRGLAGGLIDSYETGMQNWTREFPAEFVQRCGYDLRKYLPAMTGRIVDSPETSERFLWDIRRTCADLMGNYYYGRFAERCRQYKMKAYAEPYSGGPFEEMQAGARLDVPMGEFWVGQGSGGIAYSVKLAGSIAHLFGKPVVGAESFTGDQIFAMWQNYPYQMKGQGDLMYTLGLNQFIFHRNAMQPHPTALPGMTMGPWGWECDRTNSLYGDLAGWFEYAARTQNMLRQGTLVADLVYYAGVEVPVDTPVFPDQLHPAPPAGYYYDVTNEEGILRRMQARNGRITLPDGLSYRVLVLPQDKRIGLEVLRKVRDMVREGIAVVGPKPEMPPGLTASPGSDAELRQIAEEVWGDLNGTTSTERTCGKGRVFWGLPMASVLEKLGIAPDCDITSQSGTAPINFIHRRVGDAEVYFLANRRRRPENLVCTFRVEDRQPELWNPETGKMSSVNIFDQTAAGTRLPLQFGPSQSVFILFRSPASVRPVRSISKEGASIAATRPFPHFQAGRRRDVTNNFTIAVWVKPDLDAIIPPVDSHNGGVPIRSLVVSAPAGDQLYGSGHASCAFTAGRNGIAVFEHTEHDWRTVLSAPMPISGWTHVTLVYNSGKPSLFVNGKLAGQGEASGRVLHPGLDDVDERGGAEYFDGDMGEPALFKEVLNDVRIRELAASAIPASVSPPEVDWVNGEAAELLFWQNGNYHVEGGAGALSLKISEISEPVEVPGPWQVSFPPNHGAPPEITLPKLISLHEHSEAGVKYFSGTATYRTQLTTPAVAASGGLRLYLDLGWVHVVARVRINGQDLGLLWKPPFIVDITRAVRTGKNSLEVLVTNQWVNRLIGDEHLPPENEYAPGGNIKVLPQWYLDLKPKPPGGRTTFATWKHFEANSPLLVAGLVGPVRLRTAVRRQVSSRERS